MRLPSLLLAGAFVLAGAAFLAAACGGGHEDTTASSRKPAATATAEPVDDQPADTSDPVDTADDDAEGHTLEIAMVPTLTFDKTELKAQAGRKITVRFDNRETGVPHNWAIYTDDRASDPIAGANEKICLAPCADEITFGPLEPGEYFFRCDVHPTIMTGDFIVE